MLIKLQQLIWRAMVWSKKKQKQAERELQELEGRHE